MKGSEERDTTAITLSPCHLITPSRWRAWGYLVWLSFQRQARAHLMVWIALGLLALLTLVVALNTRVGRWGMWHWRSPYRVGPTFSAWAFYLTHAPPEALAQHAPTIRRPFTPAMAWHDLSLHSRITVVNPRADPVQLAVGGACSAALQTSGFYVFSTWVVFSIFATFLLPFWSLSFATEALGREREAHNLLWVLSRPLSRPAIYLAKFVAILPWSLALNLGGFALLCAAAGEPGRLAFHIYWPAVLCGTLAFAALFHLLGAWFRRAAVVAILYAFFLETIVGNLPGHLKRASISFYTRCLMFDRAHNFGIHPERPTVYLPVSGTTALWVLAGVAVGLLAVGMWVFARREYLDLS
jgi:ABC-type transport system involved in multi-copper enzyme maturation permease subunit